MKSGVIKLNTMTELQEYVTAKLHEIYKLAEEIRSLQEGEEEKDRVIDLLIFAGEHRHTDGLEDDHSKCVSGFMYTGSYVGISGVAMLSYDKDKLIKQMILDIHRYYNTATQ